LEKEKLLNLLLSEMFNAVTENDLLTIKGNSIFLGEKELDKTTVEQYIAEAHAIKKMTLYKALHKHFQAAANRHMFQQSKSIDDLTFGKAVLWNMDVYDKQITAIGNIKNPSSPVKEPNMKPLKKTK
jgi:hypothetical protein